MDDGSNSGLVQTHFINTIGDIAEHPKTSQNKMFTSTKELLLVQVLFCMRRAFGKLDFRGSLSTEPGLS